MLAVRQIRLSDFRNYRQLRLECGLEPVVLVGANGAGKTNLLEALSFLAPGRGLRRAGLQEICRQTRGEEPASTWAVAAAVDTPEGRLSLGTGLEPARGDGSLPRRVVRIDGRTAASQTALGQHVACVWLTPQLDRLFLDGPRERRRFLDRLVTALHPEQAGDAAAYENALRQRARLLAEGQRDVHWLTALEDSLARHGVAMAAARADTVQRLDAAARLGVGPFPRAALAMAGEIDDWVASMPAIDAEDRLRGELARSRLRDAESGTTSCGPHRSDLAVRHLDLDLPAAEGSTGQQKALLVSIALAHARLVSLSRGRPPLLLLDEIAAHLDAERRAGLFDEVVALGAQSWMTGTDAELFSPLAGRAQILRVADGQIAAI
jgi:DNA replication and repair protein RecF